MSVGVQSAFTEDHTSEESSQNAKKKVVKKTPKSGIFCSYVA
jgi:hypothetical protein